MSTIALENRRVLILNRSWVPIAVEGLCDALGNLFPRENEKEAKAKIICPESYQLYTWESWRELEIAEDEPFIQGFTRNYKIPEVMLSRFNKVPLNNRIRFSRRTIYKRDEYKCQYCGGRPGSEELTIDHIVPKSQGGETEWTNCILACVACNSKKANRTPEQAHMKLLSVPKKPRFSLFKGEKPSLPKSWEAFLSEAYWNVELEN